LRRTVVSLVCSRGQSAARASHPHLRPGTHAVRLLAASPIPIHSRAPRHSSAKRSTQAPSPCIFDCDARPDRSALILTCPHTQLWNALPFSSWCVRAVASLPRLFVSACASSMPCSPSRPRRYGPTVVNISISSSTSRPARPAPASDQTENWASSFVRHSCEPAHRGATKTEQSIPCPRRAGKTCDIVWAQAPAGINARPRFDHPSVADPTPLVHKRGHRRVSFADLRVRPGLDLHLPNDGNSRSALASLFTVTHSQAPLDYCP
jgi:hypothetical protein